eukprot:CFRG8352T1
MNFTFLLIVSCLLISLFGVHGSSITREANSVNRLGFERSNQANQANHATLLGTKNDFTGLAASQVDLDSRRLNRAASQTSTVPTPKEFGRIGRIDRAASKAVTIRSPDDCLGFRAIDEAAALAQFRVSKN